MSKFILKFFVFIAIIFTILLLVVFSKIYKSPGKLDFNLIPKNNLANSFSYRAKMDHLVKSDNFKNCTFLIAGSSMSLCDISGLTIENKTGECVYNISSWGFRPRQVLQLLDVLDKKRIKYLVCAFSNCDFGYLAPDIDTNSTKAFINEGKLSKYWLFIKEMKMPTLVSDIRYRKQNLYTSNSRGSLNFDKTGTVQYDPNGFAYDNLWVDYIDTTGFSNCYKYLNKLDTLCKSNNITLFLVYLPMRNDLLTAAYRSQNQKVAALLKNGFGNNFIDLHNAEIPGSKYCDGYHLFKDGAEQVTNLFLDSIHIDKKNIL